MPIRVKSACIGMLGGLGLGALLWLVDFFAANGADHLLGLIIGLTLGCGIMAFLFPISGSGGFWIAGFMGLLGPGDTSSDPIETRGEDRD